MTEQKKNRSRAAPFLLPQKAKEARRWADEDTTGACSGTAWFLHRRKQNNRWILICPSPGAC